MGYARLNSLSSQLQSQMTPSATPSNGFQNNNNNNSSSNNNNNGLSERISQYADKIAKAGRRCSLGFVRGMGRRGSLLFDGDEVLFGDKKFYFTTDYLDSH